MMGNFCISITTKAALKRCHSERYASSRKPTTSPPTPIPHHNIAEVLELGALSGGFSPVPLIHKGKVVDVAIEYVFEAARLFAPTVLNPPASLSCVTSEHELSYVARHRMGDTSAREEYVNLTMPTLTAVVEALPKPSTANIDDLVCEARMRAWVLFGSWDPKTKSFVEHIVREVGMGVKSRLENDPWLRIENQWWLKTERPIHNNVHEVLHLATQSGWSVVPLVYMGRVVDGGDHVAMARRIALTLSIPQTDHKKITLEHELSFVDRFKLGDKEAAWEYIHANRALVARLVKKARRMLPTNDLPDEDLFAEGQQGAFEAFKHWDPTQARFSTYAWHWVLSYLQGKAARGGAPIAVRQELHLALSRAKSQNKKLSEIEEALERVRVVSSLDDTTTDNEGRSQARRAVAVASDEDVEGRVASADAKRKLAGTVREAMCVLSERERAIICERYFGGDDDEQTTLESIGQRFGVSRERIRQIEASARRKLKIEISSRFGGDANIFTALGV